jgi:hypothetical protein
MANIVKNMPSFRIRWKTVSVMKLTLFLMALSELILKSAPAIPSQNNGAAMAGSA